MEMKSSRQTPEIYGPVVSSLIKKNCDAHCHFQYCPDEIEEIEDFEVPEFKSNFEKIDSKDFNLSVHV